MIKKTLLALFLVVFLESCSISIAQNTPTPLPPTVSAPTAAATLPGATVAASTATAPVAWAGPGATGRLIYTQGNLGILVLDMVTGKQTTLYTPPTDASVRGAALSPDGKQMVIAYAPPPAAGQPQLGFTDIYVMPADASQPPTPVLEHSGPTELYATPIWSPDGKYIYYGHFTTKMETSGPVTKYSLNRLAYPQGQPELVADGAFWPHFSADGKKIVYIAYDVANDISDIVTANADGSDAKLAMPHGSFTAVDAPLFYPDGQSVLFSAVGESPAAFLNIFDILSGVQVANAHDVPSDFWRVSLTDGKIERLTRIQAIGMYASFSPDSQLMAFMTTTGMYLSKPDGTELKTLLTLEKSGTLEWTP